MNAAQQPTEPLDQDWGQAHDASDPTSSGQARDSKGHETHLLTSYTFSPHFFASTGHASLPIFMADNSTPSSPSSFPFSGPCHTRAANRAVKMKFGRLACHTGRTEFIFILSTFLDTQYA
ncbi:hypothetical protein GOP47_0013999 [Adiantum capillus-veneris]|uniref:Uncharacterized protein n=1 Tax=Adiantum capillus-veneris TaxID=13818 RepID=A0A9D4UQV4_ADICA|nr:hypothetical protein GOP47_0013999 [Adiantum capillus-veneris]